MSSLLSRLSAPVLAAVVLAPTVGCREEPEKPYGQDAFSTDYAEAVCTLYQQCEVMRVKAGYEDYQACASDVAASAESCSGFVSKQAIECVDAVNTLQCDDLFEGDWPEACSEACSDDGAQHGFSVE
jgi:hypothetical protein